MVQFAIAYFLFLLAHILPAAPCLRRRAVRRLGHGVYLALYSTISIILLGWLVIAALSAPTVTLWRLTTTLALVPVVVMPFAFILLIGGFLSPNPLSISWRRGRLVPEQPGIVAVTRHPVLWAFVLWAFAHAAANGNVTAVALFGGLGLYAVFGFALADASARRRLGNEVWMRLALQTSILPFAAIATRRTRLALDNVTLSSIILGIVLYVAFICGGHQLLIGVDPIAMFR